MRHAWRAFVIAMTCIGAGDIDLVELHGADGQRYWINPAKITSLRAPINADLRSFGHGAKCIVVMVNGKFLAVREDCDKVRNLVDR